MHEGNTTERHIGGDALKIVGFTQDRGACTRLRIWQPLKKIESLKLAEAYTVEMENPEEVLRNCDVAIFGRAAGEGVQGVVKRLKAWGKKVVLDLDDNIFEVSPFSPHYKQLGTMRVNIEDEYGFSMPMWEEGQKGFNVKPGRKIRGDFIKILREVDSVTVTTEPLRKEYSRFNDSVYVIPNAIDFKIWDSAKRVSTEEEIRVLYTGAANHFEHFLFIREPLYELQKKHKNMILVFVGTDWRHTKAKLDYSRVEVHPWVDFEAYPYLLKSLSCDIGIAPITESKFDDCRSELKWIEYSALGLATVASSFGPYKRSIRHSETGLLAETQSDWVSCISSLIDSKPLREEISRNAYKECRRKFNLDYMVDEWMNVFNKTKNGKRSS